MSLKSRIETYLQFSRLKIVRLASKMTGKNPAPIGLNLNLSNGEVGLDEAGVGTASHEPSSQAAESCAGAWKGVGDIQVATNDSFMWKVWGNRIVVGLPFLAKQGNELKSQTTSGTTTILVPTSFASKPNKAGPCSFETRIKAKVVCSWGINHLNKIYCKNSNREFSFTTMGT